MRRVRLIENEKLAWARRPLLAQASARASQARRFEACKCGDYYYCSS